MNFNACKHKGEIFPIRSRDGWTLVKCVVCGHTWSVMANAANGHIEFEQLELFSEKEQRNG